MTRDCDYAKKHGKFICILHDIIVISIKVLAILTVIVIILGIISSFTEIYYNLIRTNFRLDIAAFFNIFSEIMIVLIAVEIFQNIAMYIKTDVIPIKLVLATALIAVARKFIIIDASKDNFLYILALAFGVIAISFSYWLISKSKKINNNLIN
jgi:uncharacterized membrane protein (DUF373 family)